MEETDPQGPEPDEKASAKDISEDQLRRRDSAILVSGGIAVPEEERLLSPARASIDADHDVASLSLATDGDRKA